MTVNCQTPTTPENRLPAKRRQACALQLLCILLTVWLPALSAFEALNETPVAYGGRFRPLEAYARLHQQTPIMAFQNAPELRLLPSRYSAGEWLPIGMLVEQQGNFTAYPDAAFQRIQIAYEKFRKAVQAEAPDVSQQAEQLGFALLNAYQPLAGTLIKQSAASALSYPSIGQLRAELLYYRVPWIPLTIGLYLLGALLLFANNRAAFITLAIGFSLHTFLLLLRCYVLARPPVANMFETLLFVPWISMLAGWLWIRNHAVLGGASITSAILLTLLLITNLSSEMENVQAVLDSHYWLIIHVLMVVGSYGVFLLCGLLGHVSLISSLLSLPRDLEKSILHTMYLGTALLIPGTILGGVWAAQSWGRFWDWDPKESWAFITSCIYLIIIHAYRYQKISAFGLAIGSVVGVLGVSFTWYGVNYILGTGLHSYGFGAGGEGWYYLYFTVETAFIGLCFWKAQLLRGKSTHIF